MFITSDFVFLFCSILLAVSAMSATPGASIREALDALSRAN
jgi:hypothetical protein